MKNKKIENDKIPAVLIANDKLIETFIPIKGVDQGKDVIPKCIELGYSKFIILLPPEINQERMKNSILSSDSYSANAVDFEFLKVDKFEFNGEYPTTIEPVYSDGEVNLGDAVFIGPNVFIGKQCKLGDFAEISNSILLGNNVVGKKVRIENSIVREDVEIGENQIIKEGLLLTEKEGNS